MQSVLKTGSFIMHLILQICFESGGFDQCHFFFLKNLVDFSMVKNLHQATGGSLRKCALTVF